MDLNEATVGASTATPIVSTAKPVASPVSANKAVHLDATTMLVATAAPVASPAVQRGALPFIQFRNPVLGGLIWSGPQPRGAFALPTLISPTAKPNDQTLFDEPQPGGQQHYLPAYRLAVTGSGNQTQFAVSLAVSSSGFLLTVKLADATDLSVISNRKREMPATRYLISATLPDRTETWEFPNATVDGTSITLTMPISDPGVRDAIYTAMTNESLQTKLILRRSPALALPVPLATPAPDEPPPQQLYQQSAVAIDTAIDFYFDKTLDQNVFVNLPNVGSGRPRTLNHIAVPYSKGGAKPYSYWQDPLLPGRIFFLPDAYKIARLATIPRTPAINVNTTGTDPSTLTVTLTFLALPVWDADRISEASAGPLLSGFGISAVSSVSILAAHSPQLLLNLPSADASSSSAPVPVANAYIDTANGISGSVTLSLAQFQQVYNAMFVTPSVLLSGRVDVTVDENVEFVQFSGRASDFAGSIFDTSVHYDPSKNQVTVVATNAIESPIHVDAPSAALVENGNAIPASLVSISPSLPVDLPPVPASGTAATPPTGGSTTGNAASGSGGSGPPSALTLVLQLAAGQSLDQSSQVELDMRRVTVIPDSRAIWKAIVQNQVVAPVKRQITISLPAEVFPPQAAAATGASSSEGTGTSSSSGTDQIASSGPAGLLAVQVVFKNGQTVTFQPSMTANRGMYTQTISLNVAIDDYVLGQGDSSYYTYRVDTITASGVQHGEWITTNLESFFVTLGN